LPCRDQENRISMLNRLLSQAAVKLKIKYDDVGNVLLDANGKINEALFTDGLHPNAEGYISIAPLIGAHLK
jgi:lysophospholipase L1-like esterase